jgi:hypothetical protein
MRKTGSIQHLKAGWSQEQEGAKEAKALRVLAVFQVV